MFLGIPFPRGFSKDAIDIVKKLLNRNTASRLCNGKNNGGAYAKQKWFASYDWDEQNLPRPLPKAYSGHKKALVVM